MASAVPAQAKAASDADKRSQHETTQNATAKVIVASTI